MRPSGRPDRRMRSAEAQLVLADGTAFEGIAVGHRPADGVRRG